MKVACDKRQVKAADSRQPAAVSKRGVAVTRPAFARPLIAERRSLNAAFTLIEIMIVVAILAIIMTVAIPAFVSAQNRRPMRLATEGVMEACATARAQAILRGALVELRVRPQDHTFEVTSGSTEKAGDGHAVFNFKLPEEIGIEELAINFQLLKEAEAVAVRFQPNGTSDEFTVVIRSLHGELRKLTLDPVTGRAHYDVLR
jgi:prepilin-type N-terminal cleavage/methylation domain-containing protein